MAKNFYGVLGVAQTATEEEIRRRFRQLARDKHPDRFQGGEKARAEREFQDLTQAFNVLTEPERRRLHDRELSAAASGARSTSTPGAPDDQAQLVKASLAQGVAAYKRSDFKAAVESFSRAVEIDPASPQAWYNLALTLSRQPGRGGRAREAIAKACELEPMKPAYLKLAGRLFAAGGLEDRAERYLGEALTWGGSDPEVEKMLNELRGRGSSRSRLFGKSR